MGTNDTRQRRNNDARRRCGFARYDQPQLGEALVCLHNDYQVSSNHIGRVHRVIVRSTFRADHCTRLIDTSPVARSRSRRPAPLFGGAFTIAPVVSGAADDLPQAPVKYRITM